MRIFALLLLLLVMSPPAGAIVVSRLYDFEPDTPAEADQVDAEFDNILDAINGNLSSENLVTGAVASGNIATGAVTQSKLGEKNMAISNSSGTVHRASDIEAQITNISGSLTVVSRPVFVGLQSEGGLSAPGSVRYRHTGGGATDNVAYISFRRVGSVGSAATVNQSAIVARSVTAPTDDIFVSYPCSAFSFIDQPGAGPFTYTGFFRVATGDSGLITVENCKLVVFEL